MSDIQHIKYPIEGRWVKMLPNNLCFRLYNPRAEIYIRRSIDFEDNLLPPIMTERELKDPTGKVVFRAVEYDGTRFPAIIFGNIANQLRELNKMTFKEGDVFVVAYPKSGQFMLLYFYDYPGLYMHLYC